MKMYGSLINRIHEASTIGAPQPEIGMGCTITGWSDRNPGTVVAVSKSGKTIKVQDDKYTRTDSNGMSESQSYTFERNPEGGIRTFRLTKRGWKDTAGHGLYLGKRERYYDYSF